MYDLQEQYRVTAYLEEKVHAVLPYMQQLLAEGKPIYIIEELCMARMTAELKPSKFLYLKSIIEDEFAAQGARWQAEGIFTYEVLNVLSEVEPVFDQFGFSQETEDNKDLRNTIIGEIADYIGE